MKILNDPRPWWGMLRGPELSIVELIANRTISAEGAAALWWAIERGASVMVVAGPQQAGKTTLATSLLPFLPENAALYVTSGPRDSLALTESSGPVYLLVNELSNHTPWYLHGPPARRAFAMLGNGVRMLGTLHADSTPEAVEVMRDDSGIPESDISGVTLVVVLRARLAGNRMHRQVVEVGLLQPAGEGVATRAVMEIHAGQPGIHFSPGGAEVLAVWAGVPSQQAAVEMARRTAFLSALAAGVDHGWRETAEAIRGYRFRQEPDDGTS